MAQVDPQHVMDKVRADMEAFVWEPLSPDNAVHEWRNWPLKDEETLAYLHGHWALPDRFERDATSARGLRGALSRLAGRIVFRVLGDYLTKERELISNMVRLNDTVAKRCDDIANAIYRRQVEEAQSQARLAGWLYSRVPGTQRSASP